MKRFALGLLGIVAGLCLGLSGTAQAQGLDIFNFKNDRSIVITGPFGVGTYKDGVLRIPLNFDGRFAGATTGAYPRQLAQAAPPKPATTAAPADDAAKKKAAADKAAKAKKSTQKPGMTQAQRDAAKKKADDDAKAKVEAAAKAAKMKADADRRAKCNADTACVAGRFWRCKIATGGVGGTDVGICS